MPIPVSDLEKADRPLDVRILEFLARSPAQAFTAWEVYTGIEGLDRQLVALVWLSVSQEERKRAIAPVEAALDSLVQKGRLRAGVVQAETHYALAQP